MSNMTEKTFFFDHDDLIFRRATTRWASAGFPFFPFFAETHGGYAFTLADSKYVAVVSFYSAFVLSDFAAHGVFRSCIWERVLTTFPFESFHARDFPLQCFAIVCTTYRNFHFTRVGATSV